MKIMPNIGPHLRYPFDLLPGGWLLFEGFTEARSAMVEELRTASYGASPMFRLPPIITGRPCDTDPLSDVTHHQRVVRPAREAGRFVISDGSWLGRRAPRDYDGDADLDAVLASSRVQVWGTDSPSLAVILLDGTKEGAAFWMHATDHLPRRLLLNSRLTRVERICAVGDEMRRLGLKGRLA